MGVNSIEQVNIENGGEAQVLNYPGSKPLFGPEIKPVVKPVISNIVRAIWLLDLAVVED